MSKKVQQESVLARWKRAQRDHSNIFSIPKAPKSENYPLSHGQQQLFFLEQLYPANPVYNFSEVYKFRGELHIEKLEKAIQFIIRDQNALRCSFRILDGNPVQIVHDDLQVKLIREDLSQLSGNLQQEKMEEIMNRDLLQPFDLDKAPLFRTTLITTGAEESVLFITLHHIITDKWSMGIFRKLLAKYYRHVDPTEKQVTEISKIQYTDYAHWQSQQSEDTRQLAYWKTKLSGPLPLLTLPTDYPMPSQTSFRGASHVVVLSAELSKSILQLSKKLGATPYILLLSAYYVLLYRYSRQRDIILGSPITKRNHKDLENVIGYFDESIVLRCKLDANMSFIDLFGEVKKTTLQAFDNKEISFDTLVRECRPSRSLNHNPFFRSMFIYHDVPMNPDFGNEIEFEHTFYNYGVSKFDLTLYVAQENEILTTEFEYSTDLFRKSTISRFQRQLELILLGIVEDQSLPISQIFMTTDLEKELYRAKDELEAGPLDNYNSIHGVIEKMITKYPQQTAVQYGHEKLSYEQLGKQSDDIAQSILSIARGNKWIVGLFMERSIDLIPGILGILKAGCSYLPLDPDYPKDRNLMILTDSQSHLVLTHSSLIHHLTGYGGNLLSVDQLPAIKEVIKYEEVQREDLAYIIYTSGSTGKPKGVPISHGNILHSTQARLNYYPAPPTSFLLMSSISFDSSKAGLFWTLCSGGKLVISEKRIEQDIERLADLIFKNEISHTLMLPTLYQLLLEFGPIDKLGSLTTVIVAGESCSKDMINKHLQDLPKVSIYNEYGPTEGTVWCTVHQFSAADIGQEAPIGKPILNTEIYLLDEELNKVPYGAIGEIYIGGPLVSGGYLNNPQLSAGRFIDHPFSNQTGRKIYKTGDLGRFRHDGAIEFKGRADQQIKIRGHRVELEEIEKLILEDKDIEDAVVAVDELKDPLLEIKKNEVPEIDILTNYIKENLTESQFEDLLESIKNMGEEEKQYILQKL